VSEFGSCSLSQTLPIDPGGFTPVLVPIEQSGASKGKEGESSLHRRSPMRRRVLVTVAVLGVLATATVVLAQQLTPHFPAWERYFTVSWQTFERQGRPYLSGYVTNQYGAGAGRVQLLIDALDGSNRVVAQRVEWLAGDVGPFSRRYFEVPAPQPASTYRVSVFAFDFYQAALIQAP